MSLLALILIAAGATAAIAYLLPRLASRGTRRKDTDPNSADGALWMDTAPRDHRHHDAGHHNGHDADGHGDSGFDGHDADGDVDLDFDGDDL